MLELKDIDTFYGPIQALKKVSLTVNEHEIVSLLGGNACGKSTTMKTILGLVKPRQGTVEFLGRRIDRLPPSQIVRAGISPVLEACYCMRYTISLCTGEVAAILAGNSEHIRPRWRVVFGENEL